MTTVDDTTVRQSKPGEEKYMLEFIRTEPWDYSMYEYRCHMRIDPDYLLVAIDNTGTPIGFLGLSRNAPNLYYVGPFIVREDLRRKGIGRKLWKAGMKKARDSNSALDGVPEMVSWYKKNGFPIQSFKFSFYSITLTDEMKLAHKYMFDIQPLSEEHWPALMSYDCLVYPKLDRERVLRACFVDESAEVFVAMKGESVVGYGSIHKQADNMYGLRNVYADNETVLEEIIRKMFEKLPTGTEATFILTENKPMPQYLKSADGETLCLQRLFTKYMIQTNTERMWLGTAHFI